MRSPARGGGLRARGGKGKACNEHHHDGCESSWWHPERALSSRGWGVEH
jgi:hypothetical protein